jgi:hypothetical protein
LVYKSCEEVVKWSFQYGTHISSALAVDQSIFEAKGRHLFLSWISNSFSNFPVFPPLFFSSSFSGSFFWLGLAWLGFRIPCRTTPLCLRLQEAIRWQGNLLYYYLFERNGERMWKLCCVNGLYAL